MDDDKTTPIKARRTEIIFLHCTPEERALIEHAAALRARGNVDAYLLSVVKLVEGEAKKS